MSISERTRKILWAKAGGRCSMCRVLLVSQDTDTDDPSVFGEEAHIVARAGTGPRAGQVADVNSYDNLILLCSKDRKRVDDQVGYYTVPRLRQIKRSHELWVASIAGPSGEDRQALIQELSRRAARARGELADRQRDHEQALHLRYLDHWRDGITTGAVVTWLDAQNSKHQRAVSDQSEALKLLGMLEADRTLRIVSCDLS